MVGLAEVLKNGHPSWEGGAGAEIQHEDGIPRQTP